jgi:peptide/nickel transport system ATP-binding protein
MTAVQESSAGSAEIAPALAVQNLEVAYRVRGEDLPVVKGIGFSVARGEVYGLVGESGCGKSTVALAAQRILPPNGRLAGGRVLVDGRDVWALGDAELRRLRSHAVSMVYQDPGRALNPSLTIGRQMAEVFETLGQSRREAEERSVAMLARVRISDPARVMAGYPHQLSGGMQQRVVIAMALAKDPALLILDEPTTGLDATIEAEVLDLVDSLRRELDAAVLFISHNLAAIAGLCDRVGVLYGGYLVEEGPARALFSDPRHPYTAGLLRCLPRARQRKGSAPLDAIPGFLPPLGATPPGCIYAPRCPLAEDRCRTVEPILEPVGPERGSRCHFHERVPALFAALPKGGAVADGDARARAGEAPVLELASVSKTYQAGGQSVRALRDVSLTLQPGETLGLVGESGSGKTTLARLLLGIAKPDPGGRIVLAGDAAAETRTDEQIKALQIVFQNPDSALNRSHTVRRLIGRAVRRLAGLFGAARDAQIVSLLDAVRLTRRQLASRPRQLSGGMKQRVAIARAFAGTPRVVVCDEPTSALDVSVQAAILNLFADLQAERRVAYVFISHDLGVVRYLSDRIAVLYLGRLMEIGPAARVLDGPHHPYTEALLSAAPSITGERGARIRLSGELPSPSDPPSGCVFHTRCPRKFSTICETQEPAFVLDDEGHGIRCHLPREKLGRAAAGAAMSASAGLR